MIFAQFLLFSFIGGLIAALIHLLFEQNREIRDLKRRTQDLERQTKDLAWQHHIVQGQFESFRMVLLGEFPASELRTAPESESESNLSGHRA